MTGPATPHTSILLRTGEALDPPTDGSLPSFAADLHLDELVATLAPEPDDPVVRARFFTPLRDPDAVAYRHEVFSDLESIGLRTGLADFVAGIRVVDEHLRHASRLLYPLERQRWHLEAADLYRATVTTVVDALEVGPLRSRALMAVRDGLRDAVASEAFTTFASDTDRTLAALAGVTYRMRIDENRIVVGRHDDEPDYGDEIMATFERFRSSTTPAEIPVDVFRTVDMNLVEIEILKRVARLHPAVFRSLEMFVLQHATFTDPAVATFADELPFYLAWLDFIEPLRDAGLPFCYPAVSVAQGGLHARGLFDLGLAHRRVQEGKAIVPNDLELADAQRLVVITGPNQGGKTTFARAIGQLVHLSAIGVPVPGSEAHLGLGGDVHTLFARAEDPMDLTGRLEAELRRARTILETLRPGSVVIMNESFASTTADDTLELDRALIDEITARGAICVVVTFLAELAADDPTTVSLTGILDPLDPTRPTFRLEPGPPDPLAHARAVVDAYGLSYAVVRERIAGTVAS